MATFVWNSIEPRRADWIERYRLVDAPDWKPAGQGIDIPPQSAAVVI